ncbi:hypothetical protein E2562_013303 [Oryza meyeriana var. granulata]|uniref:Uncharacterized protein n=1 Tax=Oryza meyeriana var. granulata TaxID=110450 RepID=A0A6G1D3F3_9ORYZ|nr:hypothetical protein E2562_013303 [Oryza meyeriana var. granulata]
MDKLKMMTVTISDYAQSMMSEWESELGAKGGVVKIELSRRFEELTADVISHTAFESCYKEGKQNLKTWSLDNKVRNMLMDIIKSWLVNKDAAGYGNDFLGLMLEPCTPKHDESKPQLSIDEIIAECKTFFFAIRHE